MKNSLEFTLYKLVYCPKANYSTQETFNRVKSQINTHKNI